MVLLQWWIIPKLQVPTTYEGSPCESHIYSDILIYTDMQTCNTWFVWELPTITLRSPAISSPWNHLSAFCMSSNTTFSVPASILMHRGTPKIKIHKPDSLSSNDIFYEICILTLWPQNLIRYRTHHSQHTCDLFPQNES